MIMNFLTRVLGLELRSTRSVHIVPNESSPDIYTSAWSRTHCKAQAEFKLTTLPLWSSESWHHGHEAPHGAEISLLGQGLSSNKVRLCCVCIMGTVNNQEKKCSSGTECSVLVHIGNQQERQARTFVQ